MIGGPVLLHQPRLGGGPSVGAPFPSSWSVPSAAFEAGGSYTLDANGNEAGTGTAIRRWNSRAPVSGFFGSDNRYLLQDVDVGARPPLAQVDNHTVVLYDGVDDWHESWLGGGGYSIIGGAINVMAQVWLPSNPHGCIISFQRNEATNVRLRLSVDNGVWFWQVGQGAYGYSNTTPPGAVSPLVAPGWNSLRGRVTLANGTNASHWRLDVNGATIIDYAFTLNLSVVEPNNLFGFGAEINDIMDPGPTDFCHVGIKRAIINLGDPTAAQLSAQYAWVTG